MDPLKALIVEKSALRANLAEVRARAGSAELIANLSGDGQGIGLLRMAKLLREEGVDSFAVTETRDVSLLRKNGFTEERILMLRSITDVRQLRDLLELGVIFTVGSSEAGIALNGLATELKTVAEARVRIDSGLGQYGFLPGETDKMLSIFRHMPGIAVTGIYTRLSASNVRSAAEKQYQEFREAVALLQQRGADVGTVHAVDSWALFRCDFGEQAAVCIGSALIGRVPLRAASCLRKVGWVQAPLEELNWLDKGVRVGIGKGVELKKPTRVAVVDLGWYHGLGLRRQNERVERAFFSWLKRLFTPAAGEFAPLFRVGSKRVRVLGQVGMTATVLDVTKCDCSPGDTALLDADPRMLRGLPVELRE